MYIKDEEVIIIDPNLHSYKKRHLIAHRLVHYLFHRKSRVNYFIEDRNDYLDSWLLREHEKGAEVLAIYLLILGDKIKEILQQEWNKESLTPVYKLAEEFQAENFIGERLKFKVEYKC